MSKTIENRRSTLGNPRTLPLPIYYDFATESARAVRDAHLQAATMDSCMKKDNGRRTLLAEFADPEALKALAGQIKADALDHLYDYLKQLQANIIRHGGHVHFAATAEDANRLIVEIARGANVKLAVKGKSMATEETRLNEALLDAGIEVVETDLGEFIVQLDHDHPSHIVAPIMHKKAQDIGQTFARKFGIPYTDDPQILAETARVHLRNRFRDADMGISGVNFAVAETGTVCICTNEGNGRMCTSRPRVHVALMGMEKVIPRLVDLPVFLKLLARSSSGQRLTQYTNLITGPRRQGEHDGPEEFHLVILDNGRSKILAGPYRDTLRCIRCGACLNACPVYRRIGGHAYGSVYPGPIGALLSPLFNGLKNHPHLPQATSLCSACSEACPVKIPLYELLLRMRAEAVDTRMPSLSERFLFKLWTKTLAHRWTYVLGQRLQQHFFASGTGFVTRLPFPARGWTESRDFPAAARQTFRQEWHHRQSRPPGDVSQQPQPAATHRGTRAPLSQGSAAPSRLVTESLNHSTPLADAIVRQVPKDAPDLLDRFVHAAAAASMHIERTTTSDLPAAIDRILGNHAVATALLNAGPHDTSLALHLASKSIGTTRWTATNCREAAFAADLSITDCRAAIADTGSLLVWSDAHFGRSSTLTVPIHIVLLQASQILSDLIDALAYLHSQTAGDLPSNAVLISGPSKTADIEMNLITGVHGPKHLYVVLLEDQ